jgi:hypothetical protein
MTDRVSPEYVQAAHFFDSDNAALFSALSEIDRAVDLVVVEDPNNPLLRLHAEYTAEETTEAITQIGEQFPGTQLAIAASDLLVGDDSRERLVENELKRLQGIMEHDGMGVFVISGAKEDVVRFIAAHKDQPIY